MSLWSCIASTFRGNRLSGEPQSPVRLLAWLDSLRADVIFGCRLIWKTRATSAVAILSLALAMGSCVSAFCIIDALLLRPLPIRDPQRLYVLARKGIGPAGNARTTASMEYPLYQQMRATVASQADLLAVSYVNRLDLTYTTDEESEKAYVQYVSGSLFDKFGVSPEAGRTLTNNDDLKPRAHPVAVLSYDYWQRRFGGDPAVVGRRFRLAGVDYEIVGVSARKFTGTEPGTITDVFLPTMMNGGVSQPNSAWFRAFAVLKAGASADVIRDRLSPVVQAYQEELAKGFRGWPQERLKQLLSNQLVIGSAAAGVSGLQEDYRIALFALGILVSLILLIACANLASLMTARASARSREMALRMAIGARRRHLLQLVLVESALLAVAGTALGSAFAWWSAPAVVSLINPSDHPVRLVLTTDLRVLGFAAALTAGVTILFGLVPALRASAVQPAGTLNGVRATASRHRTMHALIAAQVAFCVLVLFDTSLFTTTFKRLSHQPTGFTAEGVLNVVTRARPAQSVILWQQVARQLQSIPGVETVALASFPPLSGSMEGGFVAVNGGEPGGSLVSFLSVSPGWFDAMKIPFLDGRDFEGSDTSPGFAIVNQTFANVYFDGTNPVGRTFDTNRDRGMRCRIIGLVRDSVYDGMRGPIPPVVYLPFRSRDAAGQFRNSGSAAFVLRIAGAHPLDLAPMLRREIVRARPGFVVSRIVSETELVEQQTIRERLLALLASFFAAVALLLAAIGLYGVLNNSLVERRRELGIRIAVGAPLREIVRRTTMDGLAMVAAGAAAGLALALLSVRYIESLLFQVKATEPAPLILPLLVLFVAAVLAALPAVIGAVRIDPVKMLRSE